MDRDDNVLFGKPKRLGGAQVENALHVLDFQEMVAGAERACLRQAALLGAITYRAGVRTIDGAALFTSVQVFGSAIAVLHHPRCALNQKPIELLVRQPNIPLLSHTGRNVAEKLVNQLPELWPNFVKRKRATKEPDATINVESHPAWPDDPALVGKGRRHATNRKTIALVDIRHRQGAAHNPR